MSNKCIRIPTSAPFGSLEPTDYIPPETVQSGAPNERGRSLYADQTGQLDAGVWECEPGGWPVVDRPDMEIATILSGSGVITDADGTTHDIAAGSVVTLPKGWTGRWDITKTVRKVYVIVK